MHTISNKMDLLRNRIDRECWFVLYTRPNFEKIIHRNLKEQGFHSYLPLQKELRHWNDRTVWIETPLFRSYVFIKTSLKNKDRAFEVNGILNYVSFGSQLAVLNEGEIDKIKRLCLYDGKVTIEFENTGTGKNSVEICDGALKGLRGYLTEAEDNKKVRIYIESLNCFAAVSIDSNSVSFKYIS
jgi:transcriptional antiterminator RfaH